MTRHHRYPEELSSVLIVMISQQPNTKAYISLKMSSTAQLLLLWPSNCSTNFISRMFVTTPPLQAREKLTFLEATRQIIVFQVWGHSC